jgi:hypothetical protein
MANLVWHTIVILKHNTSVKANRFFKYLLAVVANIFLATLEYDQIPLR